MGAAERLFALVDEKYREQRDFAADLGITPSIVSEWRRGKSESFTKEKHISKICAILHTTPEYILTGIKSGPSPERDELRKRLDRLTPENLQKVLDYLDFVESRQEKS